MDRLISEKQVIDTIKTWATPLQISNSETIEDSWVNSVCELIKAIPSAESKTGHWIYDDIANNWRCDKCGETPKTMGYVGTADFMSEHFRFCNHCGTRMFESQKVRDKE